MRRDHGARLFDGRVDEAGRVMATAAHPGTPIAKTATKATPSARKKRRDWKTPFLVAFAKTGSITKACEHVKIERSTAYRERQRDEQFAVAWADAESKVTDDLEGEAVKRALDGSDRLLEFLLKARRPDVYRENVKHEHSGTLTVADLGRILAAD